jgi:hypothetical protein
MVKKLLLSAALVAGSMFSAAAVNAQTATITVTGNILNGYDKAGAFGSPNSNLTGLPFSAIFTVQPKAGDTVINTPSLSYLFGTGGASPVTAALSIGTGTYYFGGKLSGSALASNGASPGTIGVDGLYYSSEDTDVSTLPPASTLFYVSIQSVRDLLSKADFSSYSTINLTPADNAQGLAQVANYNQLTGTYNDVSYANLSLTSISAKLSAPVPEPATWAMMIVGFGLAGVALRRQRSRGQVALAA